MADWTDSSEQFEIYKTLNKNNSKDFILHEILNVKSQSMFDALRSACLKPAPDEWRVRGVAWVCLFCPLPVTSATYQGVTSMTVVRLPYIVVQLYVKFYVLRFNCLYFVCQHLTSVNIMTSLWIQKIDPTLQHATFWEKHVVSTYHKNIRLFDEAWAFIFSFIWSN